MVDVTPHPPAKPEQAAELSIASSAERNAAVCRKWIDDFNSRDDEAEAAARTPDYIAHAPDSIEPEPMDSDGWVETLGVFLEGFPDLHITVEDTVGDAELVAQRVRFKGTHTGVFQGLPPTHKPVDFAAMEFNRMVDGKVAEHWFQLDQVTMLQQLGLKVVPGPALVPVLLAHQIKKPFRKRARSAQS